MGLYLIHPCNISTSQFCQTKIRKVNIYILYLLVVLKLPAFQIHFVGTSGLYMSHFVIVLLTIIDMNPLSNNIINILYSSFLCHKFMNPCIMGE